MLRGSDLMTATKSPVTQAARDLLARSGLVGWLAISACRAVTRRRDRRARGRVAPPRNQPPKAGVRRASGTVSPEPVHEPVPVAPQERAATVGSPLPTQQCSCSQVPVAVRTGRFEVRWFLLRLPQDSKGWCVRPAIVVAQTTGGDFEVVPLTSRDHGGFQRVHWQGNPHPVSWYDLGTGPLEVHRIDARSAALGQLSADDAIELQHALDPHYGCAIHPLRSTNL